MSRYVMVSLIPCQSPHVRPIVVMPGGTRYTLARYGQEFEAVWYSEIAARVVNMAASEEIPDDRTWQTESHQAHFVATEHRYTLDLDTGEVRRWRVLVTVEASEAGKMTVHK